MKLRVTALVILVIFIIAYGWRFYVEAFSGYQTKKDNELLINQYNQNILQLDEEAEIVINDSELEHPVKGKTAEFIENFVSSNSNYTLTKISIKKLTTASATTIATFSSLDEYQECDDLDIVELIVNVSDMNSVIEELEGYAVKDITAYPSDNYIVIDFLVGGV